MTGPLARDPLDRNEVSSDLSSHDISVKGIKPDLILIRLHEMLNWKIGCIVSEWVSDCCLTKNEQFFSKTMERTSYIWWDDDDDDDDDDDARIVLDQHT